MGIRAYSTLLETNEKLQTESKFDCNHSELFLKLAKELSEVLDKNRTVSNVACASDGFFCQNCNSNFSILISSNYLSCIVKGSQNA